jgi:3-oxoacyl-[acyl-carrier protein] reductase
MTYRMRFENQVAVVTGAGGDWSCHRVRLANEGARVASVSRSEANAQRTADEINADVRTPQSLCGRCR